MKKVAVLALCVVMFAAVQPACATTYGDSVGDTIKVVICSLLNAVLGAGTEKQRAEVIDDVVKTAAVVIAIEMSKPTPTVPTR